MSKKGMADERDGIRHGAVILGCARRQVNDEGQPAGEVVSDLEDVAEFTACCSRIVLA